MKRCAVLASIAAERGESLVGSVVVMDDEIIGEGIEARKAEQDVTFHAEAVAVKTQANADFDGEANTQKIVDALGAGTYTAKVCADLVYNDYDWYLPASGELNTMYKQLGPGGNHGLTNDFYWSSSEGNDVLAWLHLFDNVFFQGIGNKSLSHNCR